jgi:UDP-N-acetylglucosamine 2-epimerase (non-hydrolysing)
MTVLGTRPEIIRLSRIVAKLDTLCDHVIVHTGQNYDTNLNEVFFRDLGVRRPNHHLGATGTFGEQIGKILLESERLILAERPDRFLVLGDTNSGLAALMAKRLGIPVYHMEAGNRSFDERMPEEVNRRVIDHCSDVLMPYTERSRANLLREGIPGQNIFVVGNPIFEVLEAYAEDIARSNVLAALGLQPRAYFLVTAHREENVDVRDRLEALTAALHRLQQQHGVPVIVSTHPRTRARLDLFRAAGDNRDVRFLEPFGLFDFITLERNALCVLTDSGTVQEECSIFGVPNVTIRDNTERPETIECGSNTLAGIEAGSIEQTVRHAIATRGGWTPPAEYTVRNVSDTVVNIVIGHRRHTWHSDVVPAPGGASRT